jgi:hypothetical protein
MIKKNLNGSDIRFSQDARSTFEEADHVYKVDGVNEMTPVSTVVGMFFKPFDAMYWSKRKCNGDVMAAAMLSEERDAKCSYSSQAGT